MTIISNEPADSCKEIELDVNYSVTLAVTDVRAEVSGNPTPVQDNKLSVTSPSTYESSDEQSTIGSLHANRLRLELLHVGLHGVSQNPTVDAAPVDIHPSSQNGTTDVSAIDLTPPCPESTVGQCTCASSAVKEPTAAEIEAVEVDGGYGWLVVLGAFIGNLFSIGTIKSFGLLNIAVNETFECTTSQSAFIISLLITVSLLVSPFVSALCERFTCRIVVVVGGLLCATGFALGAIATSVTHLWISIGLITGLGAGCTATPSILIATRYFPTRRSLVNGLVLSGNSFGSFALPALYKYFLDVHGLRSTLLLICALCLIVPLAGCLFRPLNQHKRRLLLAERRRLCDGLHTTGQCDRLLQAKCSTISKSNGHSSLNQYPPFHHQLYQRQRSQPLSSSRASSMERVSICSVPVTAWAIVNRLKEGSCRSLSRLPDTGYRVCEDTSYRLLAERIEPVADPVSSSPQPGAENRLFLKSAVNLRASSLMLSTNDVTTDAAMQFNDDVRRIRRLRSEEASVTVTQSAMVPTSSATSNDSPATVTSIAGKLARFLDLQLLHSRLFCLTTLSIFFMAISNPYSMIQLPLLIVSQGLTNDDAVLMLSIVSAVDLVSRLSLGWLFDRPGFPRHAAFAGCQLVAGVVLLALPLAGGQFAAVLALSGALTLASGLWIVNLVPVLADYHGLERVVTAYGLVRLFYGLSTLVGPPLLGVLVDNVGDFGVQYYAMGVFCLAAGGICSFITASGLGNQHHNPTSDNTNNNNETD